MIPVDLQRAARDYVYPATADGRISIVYGDHYFRKQQEEKYGEKAWKEACEKARVEYNFGSNAVRW